MHWVQDGAFTKVIAAWNQPILDGGLAVRSWHWGSNWGVICSTKSAERACIDPISWGVLVPFTWKDWFFFFLVNFDLASDTLNADLRGDVQCPPSCTRRREMAQLIAFCSHVDCWRCYLGWSLCNRNCRMLEVTNFQIKFSLARTNSHESWLSRW